MRRTGPSVWSNQVLKLECEIGIAFDPLLLRSTDVKHGLKHLRNNLKKLRFTRTVGTNKAQRVEGISYGEWTPEPEVESVKEPPARCGFDYVNAK